MLRTFERCVFLTFLLTATVCAGATPNHMESIAVSPDGKFIAVTYEKNHTRFIYKIAVDSGIASRLTDAKTGEESSPSFSADGKQIAYSYWPGKGEHFRIVIQNIDGSNSHTWSPSDADDFRPLFSPDTKTIIFARSRYYGNYSPIASPSYHAWDFYAANLDGTNMRQLTRESFYMVSAASVSSDGKNMAVVTEGLDTPEQIAIYSLDHPEKPAQSLRPHVPRGADPKNPIFNCPNYMPDGKSILFMAATNGRHGYDYDVYRLDLGTGAVDRLTNGNGYATDLRVFADGKTAAFLKWRSDWRSTPVESSLYLLDVQTHTATSLKVTGLD